MNKELEEYYEKYFDLFSSEGWKQLQTEVIEYISTLEKATLKQGDKDVFLNNRGFIAALDYILGYEQLVKRAYEDQKDNPDADV